ncbi:hypothetical protein ACFFQF_32930 [Haladaptatus pallidirubidus]|uniref:DUF7344 domain-containing protein n=1 Tax=Haladaptatus pallidirubidus TaxID=1008152 RepID=A0AAV3UPU8_9EURY|nr:hypothetical protein [Haladaptatus pallidirubidus]
MPDEPNLPHEIPGAGGDQPGEQSVKTPAERQLESAGLDRVYDALTDRRRRYILHCLKRSRTPMALADIADSIVRWETNEEPVDVPAERERIYVSLYHYHVPKLADANLVSFDVPKKRVSLCESDEAAIQDVIAER